MLRSRGQGHSFTDESTYENIKCTYFQCLAGNETRHHNTQPLTSRSELSTFEGIEGNKSVPPRDRLHDGLMVLSADVLSADVGGVPCSTCARGADKL